MNWGSPSEPLSHKLLGNAGVFLMLKDFLTFLKGYQVLVGTDNTTVVAYIKRKRGLRSLHLHMLAFKQIFVEPLLSLRAMH